jgi:hypothetical protein
MITSIVNALKKLEKVAGKRPICSGGTGAIVEPCRCGRYKHGDHSHPPEDLPRLTEVYGIVCIWDVFDLLPELDEEDTVGEETEKPVRPLRKRDGLLLSCPACENKLTV